MRVHIGLQPRGRAECVAHNGRLHLIQVGDVRFPAIVEEILVLLVPMTGRAAFERRHDDALDAHASLDPFESGQENVVNDQKAILGVVDDLRQCIGWQVRVERVEHATGDWDSEGSLELNVVVRHECRHSVAVMESALLQCGRQGSRASVEIGISVSQCRAIRSLGHDLCARIDGSCAFQY